MGELSKDQFEERLADICTRRFNAPIEHLKRLSGGASQESWTFVCADKAYVLRRNPRGVQTSQNALPKASEAAIISAAAEAGIAVPKISFSCDEDHGIGEA